MSEQRLKEIDRLVSELDEEWELLHEKIDSTDDIHIKADLKKAVIRKTYQRERLNAEANYLRQVVSSYRTEKASLGLIDFKLKEKKEQMLKEMRETLANTDTEQSQKAGGDLPIIQDVCGECLEPSHSDPCGMCLNSEDEEGE